MFAPGSAHSDALPRHVQGGQPGARQDKGGRGGPAHTLARQASALGGTRHAKRGLPDGLW